MCENYDHRWEALAEIHFSTENGFTDENYIYCLCSRVFIRDGVKLYYVDKEDASESDTELGPASNTQDEHSHVHFSVDTSYKVKCEKDEGASCYCSATHTDNYCSTDEHDPHNHMTYTHALQPSDSGADLTFPDSITFNTAVKMQTEIEYEEDYLSQVTWEKFWAINSERIIWASWIKKYSDYINPAYLEGSKDITNLRENSLNQIPSKESIVQDIEEMRERKFSYDSKVNPYKKNKKTDIIIQKNDKVLDDTFMPIGRRRSCSEHERILSPRTVTGTDSMTNVTKMTLSSYDITSSHVTSESNSTDDYSVSSTSDDNSNDQITRIANIDDSFDASFSEDMDPDQYWQFLWKKHFGEQYAYHYANYIECLNEVSQKAPVKEGRVDRILEVECESEGNSQELPSVIEVQNQVNKIKLVDKPKAKKLNKKSSSKYNSSVGVLLQSLVKEEAKNNREVVDAAEGSGGQKETVDTVDSVAKESSNLNVINIRNSMNSNLASAGGDEPPNEERAVNLKRSHENDDEEAESFEKIESQKIKMTLEAIGLSVDSQPKGQLIYRKRFAKLRPPHPKKFANNKKIYFNNDGEPCESNISQDEREMQTDDDCPDVKLDCDMAADLAQDSIEEDKSSENLLEAEVPLPDLDGSFSDVGNSNGEETAIDSLDINPSEVTKRRRRKRRSNKDKEDQGSDLPPELRGEPRMRKYWRKRHSLFHRFDSGIRLDLESWFSVTPERVARRAAERCRCDLVVDAFCGAGGNATQLAFTCERVIAIDIDPAKIALARNNAQVYGVADRIEFIVGDFFALAPALKADAVFLSPPWGGPSYVDNAQYDLETMLLPRPATELMEAAQQISTNVALYVPRNSKSEQLVSLAKYTGAVEIEQNFLGRRFVALTAYYGDLVNY